MEQVQIAATGKVSDWKPVDFQISLPYGSKYRNMGRVDKYTYIHGFYTRNRINDFGNILFIWALGPFGLLLRCCDLTGTLPES